MTSAKIANPESIESYLSAFYWYHTIDIGGTLTDGRFDHRPYLDRYDFPESLDGKSVLDVGCADGFFSFESERRGAGSVLAVDVNRQDGTLLDMENGDQKALHHRRFRHDPSHESIQDPGRHREGTRAHGARGRNE